MRIISLLFNFSVPRMHPCRYSVRLAYTVPPVSPTPLLTDPPSPRRSAAGCTKTETFPALYARAWTIYEGHISGVMIFVDTSGESLRKMQNSGNSVGGQSEFTGHHFNSKIKRPDGVHGVLLHHKTASEQSLLTFAIAAEETEYVHISECPVFVISGSHKGISAKDMWHEVKQKFLMFIAKPLAKLGTCVEMLVNLIALNGGIIMIIINFLSEPRSSIGAAIAATVTIPPDAQRNVTFSLAWDSPEVMFPGGRVYNKLVVENVNKKVSCLKTIQN